MSQPTFRVPQKMPAMEVPEDLDAAYANMVRIAHLPSEFVFDFALKLPGGTPAKVTSRVLISPLSAKLFLRALSENVAKYEKMFGEIKIPGDPSLAEYSKLFSPPRQQPDDEDPEEGE